MSATFVPPTRDLYCLPCCGGIVTAKECRTRIWGTCATCGRWRLVYLVAARPLPGVNVERSQA